jgi:heme A synthase
MPIPSRAEVLQPALIALVGLVLACAVLAISGTGSVFFLGAAVFGAGAGFALPRWIRRRANRQAEIA